jgi:hypothetical protein
MTEEQGSILAEARDFSPLYKVHTSSGAHQASYTMGMRGYFRRGKVAEE